MQGIDIRDHPCGSKLSDDTGMAEELLTVSAVARELRRSETTVRAMERRGLLPAVRASNGARLFRADIVDAARVRLHETETRGGAR